MKTAAVESSGAGVTVVPAPEAVREPAPGACAEGGEAAARLVQIAAERDELKRRLVNAESMLAEAGQALDRFRELERRVDAMGAAYLQALARVRELEGR
ncbi:MAG: hypothetical protein K8T26_12555 [Lentisphaerae bacterium]|nr:hypothetical protein [Lentisphaerota bacterium]